MPDDPLGAPPGLGTVDTGIPTTAGLSGGQDSSAAAGLPSGGMSPGGKPWAKDQTNGKPIVEKQADGSIIQQDENGDWYQRTAPVSRQATPSGRPVSIPKGGTLYDPVSGQQIYSPTLGMANTVLNPGQTSVNQQTGATTHNPLYDPNQYAMLAQEANRQYQLNLVAAQQKWQSDRDTQSYRQATVKAQNDYASQLLGVQRATLGAQTAIAQRQMGQPIIHDNPDGSVSFVSPNEMVGGVDDSWKSLLGDTGAIQTADITGVNQQSMPDVPGLNAAPTTLPAPPAAAAPPGPVAPAPPLASQSRTGGQDVDANGNRVGAGPNNTAAPMNTDWPGATRTDIGTQIYPGSVQPGDSSAAPSPGVPTPPEAPGVPMPPTPSVQDSLGRLGSLGDSRGTGPSPADLSSNAGANTGNLFPSPSLDDIGNSVGGALGGLGSALGGLGQDRTPNPGIPGQTQLSLPNVSLPDLSQVDPNSIGGQGALNAAGAAGQNASDALGGSAQSALGALTNGGGRTPNPGIPGQQQIGLPQVGMPDPSHLWDWLTGGPGSPGRQASQVSGPNVQLPTDPNQIGGRGAVNAALAARQQAGNTLQGGANAVGGALPNPAASLGLPDPTQYFQSILGGYGGGGGEGDPNMDELGAGDNLGQSMLPPPGGTVPPVPPDAIVGMGHQFGEEQATRPRSTRASITRRRRGCQRSRPSRASWSTSATAATWAYL